VRGLVFFEHVNKTMQRNDLISSGGRSAASFVGEKDYPSKVLGDCSQNYHGLVSSDSFACISEHARLLARPPFLPPS
jgi:hypothetical protein